MSYSGRGHHGRPPIARVLCDGAIAEPSRGRRSGDARRRPASRRARGSLGAVVQVDGELHALQADRGKGLDEPENEPPEMSRAPASSPANEMICIFMALLPWCIRINCAYPASSSTFTMDYANLFVFSSDRVTSSEEEFSGEDLGLRKEKNILPWLR